MKDKEPFLKVLIELLENNFVIALSVYANTVKVLTQSARSVELVVLKSNDKSVDVKVETF